MSIERAWLGMTMQTKTTDWLPRSGMHREAAKTTILANHVAAQEPVLRAACRTVARSRGVAATRVSGRCAPDPSELAQLREVAETLARAYGLEVDFTAG